MLPPRGLGGAVRRLHPDDERAGPESTSCVAELAIIREAQREPLIALLEQPDRLLQVVLALAGDAQLVALDLRLHLQAGLADRLGQRPGLVLRDAVEEGALDPVGAAAGGPRLRRGQRLERHRAL